MYDVIQELRSEGTHESSEYTDFKRARGLFIAALLGVVALALAALYFSTRWGPGIGGDATIYITSARNLVAGRGFGLIDPEGKFRLLPYFAPFFSLVLAGFELARADLVQAARWWNMLMFAGLVALAGGVTFRLTRSALFGLAAALILAASPILIPIFSWAMSEPMALFLGFAGLYLALAALRPGARNATFIFSALLTGLSFLTRYSSAAFIGAAALALLLFGSRRLGQRLADAVGYTVLAALPTAIWLALDYFLTATVSSRSVESSAGMAERLSHFFPQVLSAVLTWLVPFSWIDAPRYPAIINRALPWLTLAVLVLWLVAAGALALRRRSPVTWGDERLRWAVLLALLAILYLAVILAVYVTTYPPITIDNRMLSPVHIAVLWLAVMLAAVTAGLAPKTRWLGAVLVILLLAGTAWFGWRSLRIVQANYDKGLGYSSPEWRDSQTLQAIRDLPMDTPIVTNETTALLFLTGRNAYPLKEIYQDAPSAAFTRYGEGDLGNDPGQRLFLDGRAPLVLFDTISVQLESLYGDQTAARLSALTDGLRREFKGNDGAVYYYEK